MRRKERNRRFFRECNIGILCIQMAMFLSLVVFCVILKVQRLPLADVCGVVIDCLLLALLTLMYQSNMRSPVLDQTTVSFMSLVAVTSLQTYTDGISRLLEGEASHRTLSYTAHTLQLLCTVAIAWLFWMFTVSLLGINRKKIRLETVIVFLFFIVGMGLSLLNLYGKYYFTISPDGFFVRVAETYYISLIPTTAILLTCIVLILRQKNKLWYKATLIVYPLLPYIGSLLLVWWDGPSLTAVLSFGSLFFVYGNLYIHRERELAQMEQELAQSDVNSMLLQINPHFIYNTLGSVASLCIDDPERAREMLLTFSDYLRNNFGEMAKRSLIPFKDEIRHLRSYVAIEKQRFPDIEVIFDLKATDFDLPSLSVQPLVENAITHGIMGREEGGTVTVISYEDDAFYHIIVKDDGVGFETLQKNDGRNHIGIANVSNRLKMLCDGELIIDSTPGVGTSAAIYIPKGDGTPHVSSVR